jgi:hypothetical protein
MTRLLRSVLRAKWLRGALIALLLLAAQHGALTHALMHAGWLAQGESEVHATALVADHGHDKRARQATESCALDLVYNQVLGGVHVNPVVAFDAAERILVVAATLALRSSITVVPYDSRGPPSSPDVSPV